MLDETSALAEIQATLRVLGKTSTVSVNTRVLKDLDFDSVGVLDFVMALETRLDIVIPMERMAEVETVGNLVQVLVEQTRDSPACHA